MKLGSDWEFPFKVPLNMDFPHDYMGCGKEWNSTFKIMWPSYWLLIQLSKFLRFHSELFIQNILRSKKICIDCWLSHVSIVRATDFTLRQIGKIPTHKFHHWETTLRPYSTWNFPDESQNTNDRSTTYMNIYWERKGLLKSPLYSKLQAGKVVSTCREILKKQVWIFL